MSLYMETTKIDAVKTAGEISNLLRMAGAQRIVQDYEPGTGRLISLRFGLPQKDGTIAGFRLPVRTAPVFEHLQRQVSPRFRERKADDHREQAERVAWRQILRWTQAQLALTETGMVATQEVFFPYLLVTPERTAYEDFAATGRLLAPVSD